MRRLHDTSSGERRSTEARDAVELLELAGRGTVRGGLWWCLRAWCLQARSYCWAVGLR